MSMTALPIVSALRDRMQWHQARQKVLAENVANADTPGFKPRDLAAFAPSGQAASARAAPLAATDPGHLPGSSAGQEPGTRAAGRFETRPSGNGVHLEDEMMKVADNQSEYQLAAALYQKSLAMLRSAAGVRGS